MSERAGLKLYSAHATVRHLTWDSHEKDIGLRGADTRLPFPLVASSKRHAEKLAKMMFGQPYARVMVSYVGPCEEPRTSRRGRNPKGAKAGYPLVWFWRARLGERKGQRCRVLARGRMNTVLVEFEDGFLVATSRHAVRRS